MFGFSALYVKQIELVAPADIVSAAATTNTAAPQDTPASAAEPTQPVTPEIQPKERVVEAGRSTRRSSHKEASETHTGEPVFQTTPDAVVPSPKMKLFNKAFEQTTRTLEYQRLWNSGNGYFNGVIDHPDVGLLVNLSDAEPTEDAERFIKVGEMVKSIDDHGRRLLIIGTRVGAVVVFERYGDGKSDALAYNAPFALTNTLLEGMAGYLEEPQLYRLLGDGFKNNIGQILEELYADMVKSTNMFFEDVNIEVKSDTMAAVVGEGVAVHH